MHTEWCVRRASAATRTPAVVPPSSRSIFPPPQVPSRNFGHLAFGVDDIYRSCEAFLSRGIAILRPPRDGQTAFVKSPDGISVKLVQKGAPMPRFERWQFHDAGEV